MLFSFCLLTGSSLPPFTPHTATSLSRGLLLTNLTLPLPSPPFALLVLALLNATLTLLPLPSSDSRIPPPSPPSSPLSLSPPFTLFGASALLPNDNSLTLFPSSSPSPSPPSSLSPSSPVRLSPSPSSAGLSLVTPDSSFTLWSVDHPSPPPFSFLTCARGTCGRYTQLTLLPYDEGGGFPLPPCSPPSRPPLRFAFCLVTGEGKGEQTTETYAAVATGVLRVNRTKEGWDPARGEALEVVAVQGTQRLASDATPVALTLGESGHAWVYSPRSEGLDSGVLTLRSAHTEMAVWRPAGSPYTLVNCTTFACGRFAQLTLQLVDADDAVIPCGPLSAAAPSSTAASAVSSAPPSSSSPSTSPVAPSSPSPLAGGPLFVGLRGQRFTLHLEPGKVYSLIVDHHPAHAMRINARFTRVEGVEEEEGAWRVTEVGVWTAGGAKVVVASGGGDSVGFAVVLLNDSAITPSPHLHESAGVTVHYSQPAVLHMSVGNFEVEVDGGGAGGLELGVQVRVWAQLDHTHGLLGQTWRRSWVGAGGKGLEGRIADYEEADHDLLGGRFPHLPYNTTMS